MLKNTILLVASLFFYAWGEPTYVFLMLVSIFLNYLLGLAVHHSSTVYRKKVVIAVAVIVNIGILGFYKYANFFIDNVNALFGTSLVLQDIPLPIGISFFTFQALSYVIDVYRKDAKVQTSLINLSLYISLFPQLIAGPIVRYQTVADQIKTRITNWDTLGQGIQRFIQGLAKKVLLANPFGEIADQIFATSGGDLTTANAWIGIVAYSLQIYFDFSGYSDMAIGLGKMFGFDFEENFNYPYIAHSISEFWRRWHISLSRWFRDYIYIPLGGNRGKTWTIYRNLLVVWTLTGFWHGASWTFMAWGFYYGFIISIERLGFGKVIQRLWRPLRHMYVIFIVMIGWVFFRADNFSYSWEYISTMFGAGNAELYNYQTFYYFYDYWYIFLIGMILSAPVYPLVHKGLNSMAEKSKAFFQAREIGSSLYYLALLLIVTLYLVNSTYNPFIYFRF